MRLFPLLLLLAPALLAEGPEFEVASIKPSASNASGSSGRTGGPGTADPTHLKITTNLRALLMNAFKIEPYQLEVPENASAMFEFAAAVPEGATIDDVRIMWKNLLSSRFGLRYHVEKREMQVDDLVVGPRGHKLKENKDPLPAPASDATPGAPPFKLDANGNPTLERPALVTTMSSSPTGVKGRMIGKMQSLSAIAEYMARDIGHPVVDKTGLSGTYDFAIEFTPAPARPAGAAVPQAPELGLTRTEALQQELGLRLVKGKGLVDVIVIDNLNPTPTEN